MRALINYLRSCFCKHDWEKLQSTRIFEKQTDAMPTKFVHVYRCTKCCCVKKIKIKA